MDILTRALLPTLSLVEALWIGFCMVGLARAIPLTHGWWQDRQYAVAHKQAARAKAGLLLLAVGFGVIGLLTFDLVAGIFSAFNPPNRSTPVASGVGVAIVVFLMLGQATVIFMLEAVSRVFHELVEIGRARYQHKAQDTGE